MSAKAFQQALDAYTKKVPEEMGGDDVDTLVKAAIPVDNHDIAKAIVDKILTLGHKKRLPVLWFIDKCLTSSKLPNTKKEEFGKTFSAHIVEVFRSTYKYAWKDKLEGSSNANFRGEPIVAKLEKLFRKWHTHKLFPEVVIAAMKKSMDDMASKKAVKRQPPAPVVQPYNKRHKGPGQLCQMGGQVGQVAQTAAQMGGQGAGHIDYEAQRDGPALTYAQARAYFDDLFQIFTEKNKSSSAFELLEKTCKTNLTQKELDNMKRGIANKMGISFTQLTFGAVARPYNGHPAPALEPPLVRPLRGPIMGAVRNHTNGQQADVGNASRRGRGGKAAAAPRHIGEAELQKRLEKHKLDRTGPLMLQAVKPRDTPGYDPILVRLLYENFEKQCGTCGLRMHTSEQYAEHLQWHSTMQEKNKQRSEKRHGRSWFLTVEEWITEPEAEVQDAHFEKEEEQKVEKIYVLERSGDKVQEVKCHVCRDDIQEDYCEEREAWVCERALRVPPEMEEEDQDITKKIKESKEEQEKERRRKAAKQQVDFMYSGQVMHQECYFLEIRRHMQLLEEKEREDEENEDNDEEKDEVPALESMDKADEDDDVIELDSSVGLGFSKKASSSAAKVEGTRAGRDMESKDDADSGGGGRDSAEERETNEDSKLKVSEEEESESEDEDEEESEEESEESDSGIKIVIKLD